MADKNKTHASLPYHVERSYDWVMNDKGNMVANCTGHITQHEDAQFICKACNSHDKLVEALKECLNKLYEMDAHTNINCIEAINKVSAIIKQVEED